MTHWHVVTIISVRGGESFSPWGSFGTEEAARAAAEREAMAALEACLDARTRLQEVWADMLRAHVTDALCDGGMPGDSVVPVSLVFGLTEDVPSQFRPCWQGQELRVEGAPRDFVWRYRVEPCSLPQSECQAAQEAAGVSG